MRKPLGNRSIFKTISIGLSQRFMNLLIREVFFFLSFFIEQVLNRISYRTHTFGGGGGESNIKDSPEFYRMFFPIRKELWSSKRGLSESS